ncbi:MAG: twin-arginine translocation signal domain-containing protein [Candidatus Eisenbacteria bacterium]|nr:twin-arginine translocation signal domain-containing protein [Candidatus Eisenbacteria bacterium]
MTKSTPYSLSYSSASGVRAASTSGGDAGQRQATTTRRSFLKACLSIASVIGCSSGIVSGL